MGTALSFVTANDYKILKKAEEELTKEITGTFMKHLLISSVKLEIFSSFRHCSVLKTWTIPDLVDLEKDWLIIYLLQFNG